MPSKSPLTYRKALLTMCYAGNVFIYVTGFAQACYDWKTKFIPAIKGHCHKKDASNSEEIVRASLDLEDE